MRTIRSIKGQRHLLFGDGHQAPYAGDLVDCWERRIKAKRQKSSKRNRGFPGWKRGAASEVRILSGEELESRKRELEVRA